jgi:DNA polymerase III subunit gamma/tau
MWDVKYRPLRFTDVLGQDGAVQVLKARLKNGTALDISYIFSGGHGQGKTTLARVLARAMLCERLGDDQEPCNECVNCKSILEDASLAFHERDAASQGTVGIIRGIIEDLPFVVPGASKHIHLFDEAHRMSKEAQDVLLKPIEEKKMVGIFCTTEADKIRGTIRSRCEEHRIRRITREHIFDRMKLVLEAEKVEYEDDAIWTTIDSSGGHVRDILNRLEMVSQAGAISLEAVREYLNLGLVTVYYDILLTLDDPSKSIPLLDEACERAGPEEVAVGLAEAAMNSYRLAHKMFAEFSYVDRSKAGELYQKYGDSVVGYARRFLDSRARTKVGLICDVVSVTTSVDLPQVQQPPHQIALATTIAPAVVSPPPTPLAVVIPIKPPATRTDIGNLGEDPRALTTVDKQGVPQNYPRGHAEGPKLVVTAENEEKTLTPDDWRRTFERSWRN